MSTPVGYTPFKFHTLDKGLPKDKSVLQQLAFIARMQFLHDGGSITVCPPAVAQGASFSRCQHPRNSYVAAQSSLTVN